MEPLDIAKIAAQAALDKKASRLVLQDLRGQSDVAQFQLICSGENERQTQAICQNIEDVIKRDYGVRPVAIEGKQTGHWILLDYGSTIVHVFFSFIRDYYALEQLWPQAKFVDVNELKG